MTRVGYMNDTGEGMYDSDSCRFCAEHTEKAEPYVCVRCWEEIMRWLNSKTITELRAMPVRLFELFG